MPAAPATTSPSSRSIAADELTPILPRAPESEVVALDSGMPLAYAGYPIGGTAEQGSAQLKPTPTVQYGRITSVTDFFMFGTDPQHAYLDPAQPADLQGRQRQPDHQRQGRGGGDPLRRPRRRDRRGRRLERGDAQLRPAHRPARARSSARPRASTSSTRSSAGRTVAERFNNHRNSVIEDTKQHLASKAGGGAVVDVATFEGSLDGQRRRRTTASSASSTTRCRSTPTASYAFLVYGSEGAPISLIVYRGEGETPVADGGAASFASVDAGRHRHRDSIRVRVLGLAKNPSEKYTLYVFRAGPAASLGGARDGG